MAAATTISTIPLNPKYITSSSTPKPHLINLPPKSTKPISLNLPKSISSSLAGTAIAGAVFSTLISCDPAMATQQLSLLSDGAVAGDNRGLALLFPIVPALAWVLFNILQPALNEINKMTAKGVIIGLGLGTGLGLGGGFLSTPHAVAAEAAAAGSDNRGQLLLIVVTPAILWVLYNILQPAINQINKMRR